jgi:hypothetical protein
MAKLFAGALALVCTFLTLFYGYFLLSAQVTGKATYSETRGTNSEEVTRDTSPFKFDLAVKQDGIRVAMSFTLSCVGIFFYRHLDK